MAEQPTGRPPDGASAQGREPGGGAPGRTRTEVGGIHRLRTGTVLSGRYRIEGILGAGGMGIVYRGHDLELEVPVALKVLRPEAGARGRLIDRFRRELLLGRQVSHRNVVRIHDIAQDGDLVFLTMDLVDGESLRDVLEREERLPTERAVAIVRQLAAALECAHEQGVVHRDLKPENVLVDAAGNAFVSDFGIARSLEAASFTATGVVVGTPDYLSPEQAAGTEVGPRSDLYALGLIFYELLTGRLPFRGGSQMEILAQRMSGHPDLSGLAPLPAHLRRIVARLLERDPERRTPDASALLAELAGARPRFSLPHPRRVGIAAAILVVAGLVAWAGLSLLGGGPVARTAPAVATSAPRHSIAVLPLADETGRSDLAWAARGLAEGLTVALAEAPDLRLVESLRVFRTLEDLGLGQPPWSESQLGSLARLMDADRLITGRLRSLGDLLQLELALVDTTLPGFPTRRLEIQAVSPRELPAALARAATELQGALEIPPGVTGAASATASAEALAAYGKGLDLLIAGNVLAAVEPLEEAVAHDPAFTAAWVRLIDARQALGQTEEALAAARRAAATLGAEVSRSAAELRARQAVLDGEPTRAQGILAELVERFPHDVEVRVALASAWGEAGQLEEARQALAEVVAMDSQHPRAWFLLAKYAIQGGQGRVALDEYLVHAMVIQNRLGNEQGRAEVLNAMGVAYQQLGQLEEALAHFQQAASLRERLGDLRGLASTLRNLSLVANIQGETELAEEHLAQAQALFQEVGDRRGLADALNDLGLLAEARGHYGDALERFREALQMRRGLGDDRLLAESSNNVGFAFYLLGEYDNALVYWRQALELYEQAGSRHGVVLTRQSIGQLQLAQGRWDDAAGSFLAALEESRQLGLPEATAVSLGYLGRVAHLQGRYAAALSSYGEALEILTGLGDPRGMAEFTLLRASTWLEVGSVEAAAADLARAREWVAQAGNREQQARLEGLTGRLALHRGDVEEAKRRFAAALGEAEGSHSVVALLEARLDNAVGAVAGNQAAQAATELAELQKSAARLGHLPLQLAAAEERGLAELAAGRPEAARQALLEGLALLRPETSYGRSFRLRLALSRALAAAGDPAAAREALAATRREADELRRQLTPELREAFDLLPEVLGLASGVEPREDTEAAA